MPELPEPQPVSPEDPGGLPKTEPAAVPPPPAAPPLTEDQLDWLENQRRSRWSRGLLDFVLIGLMLLLTVAVIWILVRLWHR